MCAEVLQGGEGRGARAVTCEGKAVLLPVVVIVDLGAENLLHQVLRICAVHLGEGGGRRGSQMHAGARACSPALASRKPAASIPTIPPLEEEIEQSAFLEERISA